MEDPIRDYQKAATGGNAGNARPEGWFRAGRAPNPRTAGAARKQAIVMAMSATNVILALIVEMVGLGAVTVIAGVSDDAGTTVVTLMFGLWLLFLINHQDVQRWLIGKNGLIPRVQSQLNGVVNG